MSNGNTAHPNLKRPKKRYPDTVLVERGEPASAIVSPEDTRYRKLATELQAAIRELSGADVPIVTDTEAKMPPDRHLFLLGNVNTNRVVFRLYGYNYTPADDVYPGRGGYLIQTIHDPWGSGTNAVGLLGSDLEGVRASVGRFLETLPEDTTLSTAPRFDVRFGPDALKIPKLEDDPDVDSEMEAAEEALRRGEHTGLWSRIGERGLLYGLTGNDLYAELYKRLVYRMYRHAMSDPDNYGGIWGFDADFALHKVIPGWDLVEESPVISEDDRLRITRILFEFVTDCVDHVGDMKVPHVRHNHTTFAALGLHYAGAYYRKYYGLPEADAWLALSDECFRFQAKAFKPHEDCSGYQWLTHYHLARYSLSSGDLTFFENGCARKAADYAILTTDNLGYALPYGDNASPFGWWSELPYLRAAVFALGDGRHQWMLDKKTSVESQFAAYEYHRRITPVEPSDLDGTQVFPVDPLYYASNSGEDHLPLKKTFDKVVFRDGYDPMSQYLFLDGLSNGGHKHYDGNSISRITQRRRIWLADCDYIKSLPKFHNGVLVFRDGQSAEIPPFVELERAADLGCSGFSETTLRNYSGVDWHRNILWSRGRFFLVIDEMEALSDDDYGFRAVWQTLGNVTLRGGGLAVEQDGERFYIEGLKGPSLKLEDDHETGANWTDYPHAEPVVRILQQIVDVRLKAGETYRFFNLLYCAGDSAARRLKLVQLADGAVRIDGGEDVMFAGVGESDVPVEIPDGPTVAAAQFMVSPSGIAVVDGTLVSWGGVQLKSEHPISVEYDPVRGEGRASVRQATRLCLWSDGRSGVTVNGKPVDASVSDGMVSFALRKGDHRFALVPDAVMALREAAVRTVRPKVAQPALIRPRWGRVGRLKALWAYAEEGPFLSVQRADLLRDGSDVLVAGGRGASVCALRDGEALWRFGTGGEVRSVWAADLARDGRTRVIAGSADTKIYVLDARGELKWDYEIPLYYRKPMLKTVFAGDIDGDGKLEVIAGAESWRYYAFTHDGKLLWYQMTVHSSTQGCAADIDGDGRDEVIAGTEYHRWHCIDGSGEIRWSYHPRTGPRTNSAAAGDLDGDGRKEVIFAGADTHVHTLNAGGELLWQFNTGDEVTQVVTVDMDADGLDEVVASSMSFNVYVIKGDGRTLVWRADLGEVVRCIAVGDFDGDGKPEVVAGTGDGVVHLLANEDGRTVARFRTGGPLLTMAAADVDGDGIPEIAAASEDGVLYVLKR